MTEAKRYAIVKSGSKQYRAEAGKTLLVEKLPLSPGEQVTLNEVLLLSDPEGGIKVGAPLVAGAQVQATVLSLVKERKVISFKKQLRKGYKLKKGHRQQKTQLLVDGIQG